MTTEDKMREALLRLREVSSGDIHWGYAGCMRDLRLVVESSIASTPPINAAAPQEFADWLEGQGKFLGPKWARVAKMAWDAARATAPTLPPAPAVELWEYTYREHYGEKKYTITAPAPNEHDSNAPAPLEGYFFWEGKPAKSEKLTEAPK